MKNNSCYKRTVLFGALLISLISASFSSNPSETYSLTVSVNGLRNSKGVVQFAIYNKDGTIPDEDYEKYYKKLVSGIENKSSSVTFEKIPKGKYAINIFHDENKNGKIDKGWVLPIEGIGFSNFSSIGFSNRPNFKKASFTIEANTTKKVKIIYM